MKRTLGIAALTLGLLLVASVDQAAATYHVSFDFDTAWSGDYAPGWENSDYRHGAPPVGKMMNYVAAGIGDSGALQLVADSTPESWMWWAAVNPIDVREEWMLKQYNPWVSVDYYDEGYSTGESGDLQKAGQLYAVPSWVDTYLPGGEDWTDVQFGARPTMAGNYYHVAVGEGHPGWQDTGVARTTNGWVNLKMQLNSLDGRIHFFIDGAEVGASYRNDYIDLITPGLYCMFTDPLSAWGMNKPSVIYDNFEFGSSIPEPSTFVLLGLAAAGLGVMRMRRKK